MSNHQIWIIALGFLFLASTAGATDVHGPTNDELADQQGTPEYAANPQLIAAAPQIDYRPCTVLKTFEQSRGVYAANLWPNNTVYYAFHPNTNPSNQSDALDAMALIEGVSSVMFVARTTEPDYVVFTDSSGNNSFIGRIGGPQTINIANWSIHFVIVHEIMHALGIFHEQSRSDRNSFVQINSGNICQNCCSGGPCDNNFAIEPGAAIVGAYDFDSVMHYGQCFFSTCGNCSANPGACRTITVLPPNDTVWQNAIGQTDHFSAGDILTIQTMYPTQSVPCNSLIGDLDGDGDSDLDDVAIFQTCYSDGTGGRPECSCADQNVDEVIDDIDVEAFVGAIHGPNNDLGACCTDGSGLCSEVPATDCAGAGVTYQGDGVACADANCPVTNPGACCDPTDLSCSILSGPQCDAASGLYKGNGTSCNGSTCPLEFENSGESGTFLPIGGSVAFGDDMTLAGSARELAYYELTVIGTGSAFSVTASLYTACPASGGTLIPGTTRTFNSIPAFQETILSATFDPTITLPNSVYMVATFDDANSGWVIGGTAETGSTTDFFAVDQPPWNCNFSINGIWSGLRGKILCTE